jgi:hypothetical protein
MKGDGTAYPSIGSDQPDHVERAISFQLAQGGLRRYKLGLQNARLAENSLLYLQWVSLQGADLFNPPFHAKAG